MKIDIPSEYVLPFTKYDKLKEITIWYDAMPKQINVGDSFHENIFDIKLDLLSKLDVDEEKDGFFIVDAQVSKDDQLFVLIQDVEGKWKKPKRVLLIKG